MPARRYYPHVDGLRAIAVLAVIGYHLRPDWLPGGFTGVDVFFVISGYVVSASLQAAPASGFGAFVAGFYARRLRRIAPALVACLLATGLASALLIPPAWLSQASDRTGLMAFIGLGNLVLAGSDGDYFSPRTEYNPYAHTWSLGVEEQFYLLFPLLFYGWVRGGAARRAALVATAVAAVVSLACAWHWSGAADADAFYLLPGRFWQLAAGVLLFQGLAARDARNVALRIPAGARAVLGWVALGALLLGLLLARPGRTPWPDGVLPVLGTVGVLYLLHPDRGGARLGRVLAGTPLAGIGKLSYSLYLWHWPVFVLFRWTVGLESPGSQVLAPALALLLALASYFLVERPLRYTRLGRGLRPAVFVAAAVALVVAAAFGFSSLYKQRPALSLSVVVRDAQDWYPEGLQTDPSRPDCRLEHEARYEDAEIRWTWSRSACGPGAGARRVFVLGDSHALGYAPMLQRHVLASGDEVRVLHRTGCGYPELTVPPESVPAVCVAANTRFLGEIRQQARPGDVLFLPSLRLPRLSQQWQPAVASEAVAEPPAAVPVQAEAAASRELAPLAAYGVHIVFEAPKPLLPAPPYRCSDRFNAGNPVCAGGTSIDRAAVEGLRAPILQAFARLERALPGASVWDPLPLLCDDARCDAWREGRPLFFDGDHVSGHANRLLAPGFGEHLAALRSTTAAAATPR